MLTGSNDKSDEPLYEKHNQVIKVIKKNKRLRTFPTETAPLRKALLQFIEDVVNDIYAESTTSKPNKDFVKKMDEKSFMQIYWRAKELFTYRAFLGELNEHCQDPSNYLQVVQNSDISKEMKAGNVYIIHENLIRLYNFIQHYNNLSESGKTTVINLYTNPSERLLKELYELTEHIEKLKDDTQPVKLYLQSLVAYTVAQLYSSGLANAEDNALVVQEALKNVFITARIGEIYIDRHSSPSASSYKVHVLDPKQQSVVDELTLGQGLFSRIPAHSFADLCQHVASLGVLSKDELTTCMDKAKTQFENTFPDKSDAYSASKQASQKHSPNKSHVEASHSDEKKKLVSTSLKR